LPRLDRPDSDRRRSDRDVGVRDPHSRPGFVHATIDRGIAWKQRFRGRSGERGELAEVRGWSGFVAGERGVPDFSGLFPGLPTDGRRREVEGVIRDVAVCVRIALGM